MQRPTTRSSTSKLVTQFLENEQQEEADHNDSDKDDTKKRNNSTGGRVRIVNWFEVLKNDPTSPSERARGAPSEFHVGDTVEALWDGITNNVDSWFSGTITARRKGSNFRGWYYDIQYIDGDVQTCCREKNIRSCTAAAYRKEKALLQKKLKQESIEESELASSKQKKVGAGSGNARAKVAPRVSPASRGIATVGKKYDDSSLRIPTSASSSRSTRSMTSCLSALTTGTAQDDFLLLASPPLLGKRKRRQDHRERAVLKK